MPIEFSTETLTVTINGLEFEVYSGLSLTPRQLGTIQLASKKLQSMAQVGARQREPAGAVRGCCLDAWPTCWSLTRPKSTWPPSTASARTSSTSFSKRFFCRPALSLGGVRRSRSEAQPLLRRQPARLVLASAALADRLLPPVAALATGRGRLKRAVNVAALGSGSLRPGDSRRAMEALKRQARNQSQARRPSTRAEILSTLAAVGLPVTKVRR